MQYACIVGIMEWALAKYPLGHILGLMDIVPVRPGHKLGCKADHDRRQRCCLPTGLIESIPTVTIGDRVEMCLSGLEMFYNRIYE